MSSGVVRRRVHHEDVGGRKFEKIDAAGEDGSDEPLLLNDVRQPPRPSYVSTTTMRITFSICFRLCYTVAEVIPISLVRFEGEWASKREVYVLLPQFTTRYTWWHNHWKSLVYDFRVPSCMVPFAKIEISFHCVEDGKHSSSWFTLKTCPSRLGALILAVGENSAVLLSLSCASSILLVNNIDCGLCLPLQVDDSDDDWREKRRREEQAWTQIFSRLVVQWAQWFSKLLLLGGRLYIPLFNLWLYTAHSVVR